MDQDIKGNKALVGAGAYEPEHSMENFFVFLMSGSCLTLAVSLSLALLLLMEGGATNPMI